MDHRNGLQKHIVGKREHFRPVYDVWTKFDLNRWIGFSDTIVYTVFVNVLIKEIFRLCKVDIHVGCCCKISFVCGSSCDRTGIHKSNGSNLSVRNLRTFTVREVTCRMTDAESFVARHIAGTKTWSTESGTYGSTCLHKICNSTIFYQFHKDRLAGRIYTQ